MDVPLAARGLKAALPPREGHSSALSGKDYGVVCKKRLADRRGRFDAV